MREATSAEAIIPLSGGIIPSLSVVPLSKSKGSIQNYHMLKVSMEDAVVFDIGGPVNIEGGYMEADSIVINAKSLVLKSVQNLAKNKSSGLSLSGVELTSLKSALTGVGGYYGRGESKWIDDVAAIIGKQQINLVVDETLKIAGAVVANAERNADGSLTDKGKLYIKAAEVITESIYGYDDGILLGASFSGGASSGSSLIGNSFGAQAGYTDKTQEVKAARGKGVIDAPINGAHTRDINNIKEEDGIQIDPIKIEYTQVNYDKVREISTDENGKFSFAKVGEHMAQSVKNSFTDVMSVFSKPEKITPPKQEEAIIEEDEKEVKENQEAKTKENKNQSNFHPDEAKKLRVFDQYVTLLVDNGISKQEAEKTVAQLIIENEYQATKTVQVAVLPFALAAAVQGMEFISAIILAKVVGDKLAETYPKLKGAINNKIIDIQNKEENIALEKSRNDGHSNSAKKDTAGTKAAAGAPDPDDPKDQEDLQNNKEWKVEKYDKVMHSDRFGKMYRDQQAVSENGKRLWWSKDIANHGGSRWKVFEETSEGLVHYKDADKFGNFMHDKHKGPTGQFIPWKELKGLTIKGK